MSQVARGTKSAGGTSFTAHANALSAEVNTDFQNLVDAHNQHDDGTLTWQRVKVTNATNAPLIVNNSTGTNDIAQFQDNGSTVLTVADGGNLTFTGKELGPDGTKTVPAYSFSADPDTGIYRIGANNLGVSVGDTKVVDAKTTGVAVLGTTTNDSAAAGFIGEYIEGTVSTPANFPLTGVYGDLTSISLTAGDWDVTAIMDVTRNGATVTEVTIAITSTAGNFATGTSRGVNLASSVGPTATNRVTPCVPVYRVSLASTTIYYLKYTADFSVATPQATGRLSARRIR